MSTPTLKQVLDDALKNHQMGNHAQAEKGYRLVLGARPDHPDTLHLLGLLLHQDRRNVEALPLIERVATAHPNVSDYQNSLGSIYKAVGRLSDAIRAGRRAVELQPQFAEGWYNLGLALAADKQFDAAVEAQQRAINIRPAYVQALLAMGGVQLDQDKPDQAIETFRVVLNYQPRSAEAIFNLGNAFRIKRENQTAMDYYRQALLLRPDYLQANNNLACLLQQMGQMDQALPLLLKAREAHPDKARVHANLANLLAQENQWEDAIESYDRALEIQPDYHEARFNRSLALLMQGKFELGWREYESRWLCRSFPSPPRYTDKPLWRGEALGGRRLLIHAEQGMGDTLQFVRYLPMVIERGGVIVFQVQTPLQRLFKNLPGVEVISHDPAVNDFDLQCPLWSLPLIFGTTMETIPPVVAPFWFDPEKSRQWGDRLAACRGAGDRLNVGLVWSGSHQFIHNNIRSTSLASFAPFAQVRDVNFISLQKGPASAEASGAPAGLRLMDWTGELDDFADTAALVNQLDLVISTDTGTAHLAASMGKPTWIVLMFSPDFRWLMGREESPWYSAVRLFRQPRTGDWATPIQQMVEQLKNFSAR